jgi:ubiquinol-cytochrome c reductase iron-sulfur subunit
MHDDCTSPPTRRDFLSVSAGAFLTAGGTFAAWPFIDQMNPNPSTPPIETRLVDLAPIAPGQTITVAWRGQPIFVRHRTTSEIERARNVAVGDLPDPYARNSALPVNARASDINRTIAGRSEWLVVVGLCTHLGCRLQPLHAVEPSDTGQGWFCPCHAARFDLAGRVRAGPATTNLPVPPYRFVTTSKIEIGKS